MTAALNLNFVFSVFRNVCLPYVLVCDTRFTSAFWTSLHEALGASLIFGSPHQHNTTSNVERVNGVIADVLLSFACDRCDDWPDLVPPVEQIKTISPTEFTFSPRFFARWGFFFARWGFFFASLYVRKSPAILLNLGDPSAQLHQCIFRQQKLKLLSLSVQLERNGLQILTAVCRGSTLSSPAPFKLMTGIAGGNSCYTCSASSCTDMPVQNFEPN